VAAEANVEKQGLETSWTDEYENERGLLADLTLTERRSFAVDTMSAIDWSGLNQPC
jgi:hypothetical protein